MKRVNERLPHFNTLSRAVSCSTSNLLVMKVVEDDFLGVASFFQLKIDIYLRFPGLMRDHYRRAMATIYPWRNALLQ